MSFLKRRSEELQITRIHLEWLIMQLLSCSLLSLRPLLRFRSPRHHSYHLFKYVYSKTPIYRAPIYRALIYRALVYRALIYRKPRYTAAISFPPPPPPPQIGLNIHIVHQTKPRFTADLDLLRMFPFPQTPR